jgi:hypothetical protein
MADEAKPRGRAKAHTGAGAATEPDPIDADSLDEAFVKALEQDFLDFGMSAIRAMRAEKPTDYVKIVMALRNRQAGDTPDPLRELSDAELDRCIRETAARAGLEVRPAAVLHRENTAGDDGADAD